MAEGGGPLADRRGFRTRTARLHSQSLLFLVVSLGCPPMTCMLVLLRSALNQQTQTLVLQGTECQSLLRSQDLIAVALATSVATDQTHRLEKLNESLTDACQKISFYFGNIVQRWSCREQVVQHSKLYSPLQHDSLLLHTSSSDVLSILCLECQHERQAPLPNSSIQKINSESPLAHV